MPAVNLRHIEIFHAVMTTGNLTEAARMLHTSQPTVSRELARFEKVLGVDAVLPHARAPAAYGSGITSV